MYNRLTTYLDEKNIISEKQFGFMAKKSTSDAIINYLNNVYDSINKSKYLLSIFIDFRKAFDTVNHSILLDKLSFYGIRGLPLKWFRSYLHERKFYVSIGESSSDVKFLSMGVPQGSILGPVLFLIYINDIINCSNSLNFTLYADDTTVSYSDAKIENLYSVFNEETYNLYNWTLANKLSLNFEKTKYMLISTKHCDTLKCFEIKFLNHKIERVKYFKFLGVLIDDKVNFSNHIEYICLKVSVSIGILNKLNFLPIEILKILYYSMIYPHLNYGILAWGSTFKTNLKPLIILQKKALPISYI